MTSPYISIHTHDEFSLLDGGGPVERFVKRAVKFDMPALAITNHGTLGGSLRHYMACKDAGIKAIFGMEGYINQHRTKDPTVFKDNEKRALFTKTKLRPSPHFLILAKNMEGFQNLIRISNDAHKNGFYYRPRTDIQFLAEHSSGLIMSTACLGGFFAKLLEENKLKEAKKQFMILRDSIGAENLYVELVLLSAEISIESNKRLLKFAKLVKAPLLITGDAHFSRKKDAKVQHTIMLMRQHKTFKDAERGDAFIYDNTDLFFKSYKQMYATWKKYYSDFMPKYLFDEGIRNTVLISEQVEEFCPARSSIPTYGKNSDKKLLGLCIKGLKQKGLTTNKYKARLARELKLITSKGFSDYFLIYREVTDWARNQGIRIGPGRGSAGGCLVSFLIGITELDPIFHDLLFERFLDPGRLDPPDIDVDFEPERRDEVKQFIFDRFGNAATIGTYSRLQVKSVLKDVGKVYSCKFEEMNSLTASLPWKADEYTWTELLKHSSELRKWAKKYPDAFYAAGRLRGQLSHAGKHAAGVVITKDPIHEVLPMRTVKNKDGTIENIVTWPDSDEHRELSKMGFLKWDVLGVNHLSIISRTLSYLDEDIDMKEIPLDDEEALKIASRGDTEGIFQFGAPTAIRLLKLIGVDKFEDLAAITAIGRPGPLDAGYPRLYADRKKGKEKYKINKAVKDILEPTYGLIIYQEQIMKIGQILGGYSLKEVNYFRKVIGKKRDSDELLPFKERFITGSCKKGFTKKEAEQLWKDIEGFARYGFNKSHATAYALIGYQELYLKAHYPKEFMAALLSLAPKKDQHGEKIERVYLRTAFKMGLTVIGPDVNKSIADYAFDPDLRMGLKFIKNIGAAADEIVECAPFDDLEDFYDRVNKRKVSKRVVEALIRAGAMDSLANGRSLIKRRYNLLGEYYELRKKKEEIPRALQVARQWLLEEAEVIGSPLTALGFVRALRRSYGGEDLSTLAKRDSGKFFAVVSKIKTHKIKSGTMCFMVIEDDTFSIDLTMWPNMWQPVSDKINVGDLISCKFKREPAYNTTYGKWSYFPVGKIMTTKALLKLHQDAQ